MATCRSCGAQIRWVVTTEGKSMPIDVEPEINGNIEIVGEARGRHGDMQPKVRVHAPGSIQLFDTDRYIAHFVTCPDPEEWRQGGVLRG